MFISQSLQFLPLSKCHDYSLALIMVNVQTELSLIPTMASNILPTTVSESRSMLAGLLATSCCGLPAILGSKSAQLFIREALESIAVYGNAGVWQGGDHVRGEEVCLGQRTVGLLG